MSYAEQIFLAEETARNINNNFKKEEVIIKTEEISPTTAHMINHNLHNANQWYEIKLPRDATTWQLRARGNYELLYSFSPTHQTYTTLSAGNSLQEDTSPNSDLNAIYVMSTEGGIVCELEVWRR